PGVCAPPHGSVTLSDVIETQPRKKKKEAKKRSEKGLVCGILKSIAFPLNSINMTDDISSRDLARPRLLTLVHLQTKFSGLMGSILRYPIDPFFLPLNPLTPNLKTVSGNPGSLPANATNASWFGSPGCAQDVKVLPVGYGEPSMIT